MIVNHLNQPPTLAFALMSLLIVSSAQAIDDKPINEAEEHIRRRLSKVPFQEVDGLIVMEMESQKPIVPDWKFETAVPGYTGKGYCRMDGNSIFTGPPNGRTSFFIKIQNPGKYNLALRSNKDHEDDTLSNDCYTKMVGHPGYQGDDTKTYMHGPSHMWRWSTVHQLTHHDHRLPFYDLSAGVHELQISGRAKNFFIDRIVLWHANLASKSDALRSSNPESPRVGGSSPTDPVPTYPPMGVPTNPPVVVPTYAPMLAPTAAPVSAVGATEPGAAEPKNSYHINCGGEAFVFGTLNYEVDTKYVTGGGTYVTRSTIANTTNQKLFSSERYGDFTYSIPVKKGNRYWIKFHLAEIYSPIQSVGGRVFDIIVDGKLVFEKVDVFKMAGSGDSAVWLRYTTPPLSTNVLSIEFASVQDNAKCSGLTIHNLRRP